MHLRNRFIIIYLLKHRLNAFGFHKLGMRSFFDHAHIMSVTFKDLVYGFNAVYREKLDVFFRILFMFKECS